MATPALEVVAAPFRDTVSHHAEPLRMHGVEGVCKSILAECSAEDASHDAESDGCNLRDDVAEDAAAL